MSKSETAAWRGSFTFSKAAAKLVTDLGFAAQDFFTVPAELVHIGDHVSVHNENEEHIVLVVSDRDWQKSPVGNSIVITLETVSDSYRATSRPPF